MKQIAEAWRTEPFLIASHTSAISKGEPFRPELDELTMDRFELGATFVHKSGKWELDLSHGWKCFDCKPAEWGKDYRESTTITVRWYPWRRKLWTTKGLTLTR